MTGGRVRVLLADDHPVYREGLAGLLAVTDDVEVVAQAANGVEAVELAGRHLPDVAALDLNMPGLSGIEAARRILGVSPATAVVMLTMYDDDDTIFQAIRAGARGYVVKTEPPAAVVAAIRSAALGEAIFSRALTNRLARWFATMAPGNAVLPQLTPREREVLELIVHGRDNGAIATYLGVSGKTVRNLVSNVFTKLQVTDRAAAIVKAREAGLA